MSGIFSGGMVADAGRGSGYHNQFFAKIFSVNFRAQAIVFDHGQYVGPLVFFKILEEFPVFT
jgi:hypothetical protein